MATPGRRYPEKITKMGPPVPKSSTMATKPPAVLSTPKTGAPTANFLAFIRHGHDEYRNETYRDDNRLTTMGVTQAQEMGSLLLQKYGHPNIIYCSPFRRTIETARQMTNGLTDKEMEKIKVVSDPMLGRWFHGEERNNPDVDIETQQSGVPTDESYSQFLQRCNKRLDELEAEMLSGKKIWVITHTLPYKNAGDRYNARLPRRIEFATYFVVIDQ